MGGRARRGGRRERASRRVVSQTTTTSERGFRGRRPDRIRRRGREPSSTRRWSVCERCAARGNRRDEGDGSGRETVRIYDYGAKAKAKARDADARRGRDERIPRGRPAERAGGRRAPDAGHVRRRAKVTVGEKKKGEMGRESSRRVGWSRDASETRPTLLGKYESTFRDRRRARSCRGIPRHVLPETGARFVARSVIPPASGPDPRALPSLRVTSWSPMGAGGDLGKVARARTPPERAGGSPEAVSLPASRAFRIRRRPPAPPPRLPSGCSARTPTRARPLPPLPPHLRGHPPSRRGRASAPSTSTAADAAEPAAFRDSASTRALTKAQIARATVLVHRLANADSSILRDDPTLAPPPRPKLPAASTAADPVKAACVAVRARAAQAFIRRVTVQPHERDVSAADKNRPLHRILDTGRRIARDALPTKCVRRRSWRCISPRDGPTSTGCPRAQDEGRRTGRALRDVIATSLLLRSRHGELRRAGDKPQERTAFRDVVHPTVSSALTSFRTRTLNCGTRW